MSLFYDKDGKNRLRTKRFDYLNDFVKNDSGTYVYNGSLYRLQGDKKDRSRVNIILKLTCLLSLAFFIVSGCIDAGALWSAWYVVLLFGLEAISIFVMIWKSISFLFEKEPLKEYIYKKTVPWFRPCAFTLALVSLLSVIMTLIYLAVHGSGDRLTECIVYMLLKLFEGAVGAGFFILFKKYIWKDEAA